MNAKMKQNIRLSNKIVMTQQIQLAIRLLQLNSVDLQKEIDEKILSNPFLENDSVFDLQEITPQPFSVVDANYGGNNFDNDTDILEQTQQSSQTLREYLIWQIKMSSLNKLDQMISYTIIDYIDDAGFLSINLDELFVQLNKYSDVSFQEIFAVLHKIQHLDPIGVGATSLADCLMIQLDYFYKDNPSYKVAKDIIGKLEKNLHPKLSNFQDFLNDIETLKTHDDKVAEIIKSLNPKPGNIISVNLFQEQIIPDIIVSKKEGEWVIELNPEINPKIRINKVYQKLSNELKDKKDIKYIKDNLQDAKFFLKALSNRNLTILKIAKALLNRQKDFLIHGEIALKPLVIKEIASIVKMHESTVSRSTNNKYVQTPRGVYELKYFFSSEIDTDAGEKLSSMTVKEMIKKLISAEDIKSPLSDAQIADSFAENGIRIARRTVAKYREAMNILSSNDRRKK